MIWERKLLWALFPGPLLPEISGCGLEGGCGVRIRLTPRGPVLVPQRQMTLPLGTLFATPCLEGKEWGSLETGRHPCPLQRWAFLLPVWGLAQPLGCGVTPGLEWVCQLEGEATPLPPSQPPPKVPLDFTALDKGCSAPFCARSSPPPDPPHGRCCGVHIGVGRFGVFSLEKKNRFDRPISVICQLC